MEPVPVPVKRRKERSFAARRMVDGVDAPRDGDAPALPDAPAPIEVPEPIQKHGGDIEAGFRRVVEFVQGARASTHNEEDVRRLALKFVSEFDSLNPGTSAAYLTGMKTALAFYRGQTEELPW